jgi:hypothetical protein
MQNKIKKLFPNPKNPLNLRDFNRLRGRKDKDEVMNIFIKYKDNPI